MTDPLRLHYAPDNASLCVRLLLERLGMDFETALVDRSKNGQKSPEYLALNPNGFIPTLITPEGPMFETGAILLWLADQHPGTVFPAPDADDRAAALTCMFWLSNTMHPNLRHIFYPDQYGPDARGIRATAKVKVTSQLNIFNDMRGLIAKYPALACYGVPMLRWLALYGRVDLSGWPALIKLAAGFETEDFALKACAAEGLGPTPFSNPSPPNPPEGSAT